VIVPKRWRLVPRDESFFELFVRQAANVEVAAQVLFDLIAEFDGVREKADDLRKLEHDGDDLTHEIMRRLNTVFVTPFDHEDIHRLTSTLDDVLDHMEAAADLFVLHKIERPLPEMKAQSDVLVRATRTIREALEQLPRYKELPPYWIEVDRLENEGDRLYRQAIADLFNGDHRALDVLKWRDICDELEAAIDRCEDVSDALEGIALKHA
jgi:predicted phosphate transport protein (TIGR00153 family)